MTHRKESVFSKKISRRNITHLFWGIYPYKVETVYPARGYKPLSIDLNPVNFRSVNNDLYRKTVSNFKYRCMRFVPKNKDVWKICETRSSLHFYFLNKNDMDVFIEGNAARIRAIYEPENLNTILLMSDPNVYLRHTLFFDKYRFSITFRKMTELVKEDLDKWIHDFFGDNSERSRYNPFGTRRLYLNVEDDILITRMAFSQYILRIQKVILNTEISKNANDIGETPSGEGCDPAGHGD